MIQHIYCYSLQEGNDHLAPKDCFLSLLSNYYLSPNIPSTDSLFIVLCYMIVELENLELRSY